MFLIILSVASAFVFSLIAQWLILRERNKDNLIDLLLESIKQQCEFYVAHWERDSDAGAPIPTNQTMKITEFSTILDFAGRKYKLKNIITLEEEYREFYRLADDFNENSAKPDIKRISRKLHSIANDIRVELWKNKA